MAIQLPSLNTTEKTSNIISNFAGSGLAFVQGIATVQQVGIARQNLTVEQTKTAHIVATLSTEANRNTAQATYYTQGSAILADVRQNNANLIAVRNQLLLKLTTCTDPTERANTLSTITAINQSLGANNTVVGSTLNSGAAAQQIQ